MPSVDGIETRMLAIVLLAQELYMAPKSTAPTVATNKITETKQIFGYVSLKCCMQKNF